MSLRIWPAVARSGWFFFSDCFGRSPTCQTRLGELRSYSAGGRVLVDGYEADEMTSSGRGQVLIPWPNRLQDGSYEFDVYRTRFFGHKFELSGLLHAGVLPSEPRLARAA
jgi:hypothetical protein